MYVVINELATNQNPKTSGPHGFHDRLINEPNTNSIMFLYTSRVLNDAGSSLKGET